MSHNAPFATSGIGSGLKTLALMCPLIAVPAIAIFGLPQIDPLLGGKENKAAADPFAPVGTFGEEGGPDSASLGDAVPFEGSGDPFGAGASGAPQAGPFGGQPGRERLPETAFGGYDPQPGSGLAVPANDGGQNPWATPPVQPAANDGGFGIRTADAGPAGGGVMPPVPPTPGEEFANPAGRIEEEFGRIEPERRDFASGSERLFSLGIENVRLIRAANGRDFHFQAHYTPLHNPSYTRIFEAEDPNMAEAVWKVIDQIEAARQRQTKQGF